MDILAFRCNTWRISLFTKVDTFAIVGQQLHTLSHWIDLNVACQEAGNHIDHGLCFVQMKSGRTHLTEYTHATIAALQKKNDNYTSYRSNNILPKNCFTRRKLLSKSVPSLWHLWYRFCLALMVILWSFAFIYVYENSLMDRFVIGTRPPLIFVNDYLVRAPIMSSHNARTSLLSELLFHCLTNRNMPHWPTELDSGDR